MLEIDHDIKQNKMLFADSVKGVDCYNLDLMTSNAIGMAHDIQTDHDFKQIQRTVTRMQKELDNHQVCKMSEGTVETEDSWGGIYFTLHVYKPIDTIEDFDEWRQKEIVRSKVAKEIDILNSHYLKCEVFKMYEQNIITFEQMVQAHKGSC